MSPKPQARRVRGVVDTSVLIGGISGLRGTAFDPENASAALLKEWVERESFTWLISPDILSEYKEIMARLRVRAATIGRVINLLEEEAELITPTRTVSVSPDPADEPCCSCLDLL